MKNKKIIALLILALVAIFSLAVMVHAFAVPRAKAYGGVIQPVQYAYSRSFAGKAIATPDFVKEVEVKSCRELHGNQYPIEITDIGIKDRITKAGYECIAKDAKSWCCKKPMYSKAVMSDIVIDRKS